MLQLEQTFFDLASTSKTDTIVICDRGAMDPSSCKSTELLPYNFFKFQISFLGKGIETLKEEEEGVLGYVQLYVGTQPKWKCLVPRYFN